MKKQRRVDNRFTIPKTISHAGEELKISDYPDFIVFTDREIVKVLGVSQTTLAKWKREQIIPYKKCSGYNIFDVNKVIAALKDYGYAENSTDGQPPGFE